MSVYDSSDPRSTLVSEAPRTQVDSSTPISASQCIEFLELEPHEVSAHGGRTWYARSTNTVVSYSELAAGDILRRTAQPDEYAVLLSSDDPHLRITAGGETVEAKGRSFIVVPPGDSEIEALSPGTVVRLFSTAAPDLCSSAANAGKYAQPDPRVTPLKPWPAPRAGFRLRVYALADAPHDPKRFGNIFRTTNMMVNFVGEETEPRDPRKLSPHFHDDFEQISLVTKGRFVHHIRYPWGPDSTQWRPDEHVEIGAPSICVIPPPTIHTSQGVGNLYELIDVFSPPRKDFSDAGWVLNASDYPAESGDPA